MAETLRYGVAMDRANPHLRGRPAASRVRRARPTGPTPLYYQIYMLLREMLTEGELDASRPLPSEPTLAERYQVSRVTVRKTLERLENEGLVRRVRGVGTFPVKPGAAQNRTNISGLLENLISVESTTRARALSWGMADLDGDLAALLGPRALRILRVRTYRDVPISLTTLHVPERHAIHVNEAEAGDEPIIRVLERAGVIAERAEQAITAVAASALAALELGVPEGSPLIAMKRLMVDVARQPVLHQESLYAPDKFEYRMTLSRTAVGPAARWTPIA